MKVNLKKLGAIVAGATILASTAAFAGLMFGSTTLVDDNGAPVAKVVVGSQAAPSDGVAAALIAGAIVSNTYKSQTLTAQVAGTASCTPSAAAGNATGTCTISNEQTTLQITVPNSIAAGTWQGQNLIGDFMDRTLLDRKAHTSVTDTSSAYPLSTSDTADNANPFYTDGSNSLDDIGQVYMYRIGPDNFPTFADVPLTDNDAGKNYVEHQNMWIGGDNHFEKSVNDVVGNLQFFAYTIKFDGPGGSTDGVPVCTSSSNGDYTSCKNSDGVATVPAGLTTDDATETHKVHVSFMGDDWIISEMDAPTTPDAIAQPTDTVVVAGGEVKLAKESVSGILNQGESLPVDNLKIQLDDLEAHGNVASAIISILDSNGNVLKKDNIPPATTKTYQLNGKTYRVHVYKVAPGYTFGAKWADMAVYSNELDLKDGQQLDQPQGLNPGYNVALGWKNLDASTPQTLHVSANPEQVDALRTIVIYSNNIDLVSTSGNNWLKNGDSIPIVQSPAMWQLSYSGLDLKSADRSSLQFTLQSTDKNVDAIYPGQAGDRRQCILFAPYVQVSSGDSSAVFQVPRSDGVPGGTLSDNRFFVALNNGDTNSVKAIPTGEADTSGLGPGHFLSDVTLDSASVRGAICDFSHAGGSGTQDTTMTVGDTMTYNAASFAGLLANYYDLGPGTVFMRESTSGTTHYGFALYPRPAPGNAGLEVQFQKIGDGSNTFSPPGGGVILVERGEDVNGVNDGRLGEALFTAGFTPGNFGTKSADHSTVGTLPANPLGNPPQVWFVTAEKAGTGTSNDFVDYYAFGALKTSSGNPGDATFEFNSQDPTSNSLTSDNDKILYLHAVANPAKNSGPACSNGFGVYADYYCVDAPNLPPGPAPSGTSSTFVDSGYISERGSLFQSQSSTSVTFNMAEKLGHATWSLTPTSLNASTSGSTVVTLGKGDSTTVSGVTVKVLDITEQVGACSAAGGAPSCTADMSGVSAVIMPNNAPSVTVAMPYSGQMGNVVILDSDAVGVNTLVSVGGDKVNSVTASLLQGAAVDWTATPVVVKEVVQGSKIVVAGAQASDTLTAAQQFVSQLKKT